MKKLSNAFLTTLAAGLLSCGLLSQQAQAVPITGDIDISGNVTYDTNSLATATQINTFNSATVGDSTGSFSGIAAGTAVTFSTPYVLNSPKPALWSVGGFTFDLLSSTIVTQLPGILYVTGTGTVTGPAGFDATAGLWSFTSTAAGGQSSPTFSFASNTVAVPDGGSALSLLGLALVGVQALRRKFAV
jgi:hypothetical protein